MNTRVRLLALVLALTGALLSVPAAGATGGHPAGRAAGHQAFLVLSNNATKPGGLLLGFGPIHARGKDKQINAHTDRFIFPQGSVKVRHKKSGGSSSFDKTTCYGTFSEHGTWKTLSGTGSYSHVTGSGKYHVNAVFVGCSQTKPPRLSQLRIHAGGHLSY